MTNEEKAEELSKMYARQYRHNRYIPFDDVFVFSNEEINNACLKMAEWKDKQFAEEKKQWIEKAQHVLASILVGGVHPQGIQGFIKQFKQAMEE